MGERRNALSPETLVQHMHMTEMQNNVQL